jgi:hypothetical protein
MIRQNAYALWRIRRRPGRPHVRAVSWKRQAAAALEAVGTSATVFRIIEAMA